MDRKAVLLSSVLLEDLAAAAPSLKEGASRLRSPEHAMEGDAAVLELHQVPRSCGYGAAHNVVEEVGCGELRCQERSLEVPSAVEAGAARDGAVLYVAE